MRAPKPGADKKEILIGVTLSETGVLGGVSKPYRPFFNAWADMVNAKGGVYLKDYDKKLPVRFVIYDDQSDELAIKKLYNKLIIEDRVDLLLGPFGSPATLLAASVAQAHQVPIIGIESNSIEYERGFTWLVGVLDTARKWSDPYLTMLKQKTDAKTIAFIYENKAHSQEVYEGAVKKAKELGFNVVLQNVIQSDSTFFDPIIAQLKELNPDVIYISGFDGKNSAESRLVKEFVKAKISPKALHVAHHGGEFKSDVGEASELATGEAYWMPGLTTGAPVDEFNMLLNKIGITVEENPWIAIRMYALQTLETALPNAGSLDKAKIMAALKSASVDSIGGKITFNERGVGTMSPIPTQIQNGKYITIWPENIAAGKYIYPRNTNLKK